VVPRRSAVHRSGGCRCRSRIRKNSKACTKRTRRIEPNRTRAGRSEHEGKEARGYRRTRLDCRGACCAAARTQKHGTRSEAASMAHSPQADEGTVANGGSHGSGGARHDRRKRRYAAVKDCICPQSSAARVNQRSVSVLGDVRYGGSGNTIVCRRARHTVKRRQQRVRQCESRTPVLPMAANQQVNVKANHREY